MTGPSPCNSTHYLNSTKTEGNQMAKANDFQVGGKHYADTDVQAWDAITAWGLGFLDGNVVKYMSRWRKKDGLSDLLKAQHYLSKLIETVERAQAQQQQAAQINPAAAAQKFAPRPPQDNRATSIVPPAVPVKMKERAPELTAKAVEDAIMDLTKAHEVKTPTKKQAK
jgi:hypothetical protein